MPDPTVFVVDDDQAVVRSLRWLIESVNLKVEAFESARAFQQGYDASRPGCLVLDVRMPGLSGLELQEWLAAHDVHVPIIFITGHGDVKMAVKAVQSGAFDFIEKPFNDQDLLDRVQKAIDFDTEQREALNKRSQLKDLLDGLTTREREVLDLVADGLSNKAIANKLGLSSKTVEVHRGHMMAKMQASSVADLVKAVMKNNAANGLLI